jgi:hypothetical protein
MGNVAVTATPSSRVIRVLPAVLTKLLLAMSVCALEPCKNWVACVDAVLIKAKSRMEQRARRVELIA